MIHGSCMIKLLTKHGLCSINIQAREVRKMVQSALWIMRNGRQQKFCFSCLGDFKDLVLVSWTVKYHFKVFIEDICCYFSY